ncbi:MULTISPECIES: DUF6531 domain-containing protein [unclassified Pseudomonas]|uniref:DUF6531 domain-containing protein n=1 Tax=unclassified Pseudomonas TaxID=196821 RepID=UPI002449DA33|nr:MULTISPECIES: DUF6531 domain-containing protein [unclassified Pseudomonas]MDG9926509.1 DUF6531 domain-containing protein [Pseudomonas sp. GD04042]MDH0481407.1 DUF6531 domain-containing protein [Pseudomonas sp. GD04015]MDH0603356.1 DUF6531 domain-containing protein [Pseudomonas sp. GD03869]
MEFRTLFSGMRISGAFYVALVCMVCLPNKALSESYYWKFFNLGSGFPVKGNPKDACISGKNAAWTYSKIEFMAEYRVACYFSYLGVEHQYYTAERGGKSCPPGTSYNPSIGECNNDSDKGPPDSCPSPIAGNPINFSVGNKFQTESDYSGGNSALKFTRSFNSLDGLWRHEFSTHLRFAGTQYVSVVMHHGRESFFTVSGAAVTPTSADLGVLSKTASGWQFVSIDNERFTFDTLGKLTQWSNTHGAVRLLVYSGSQVIVTDNLGNSLTFTEDADHQPLTLTAPGVQISYGYDANKRLASVTRTVGGQTFQRQFHYEVAGKPNLLTGITDERGIRYATWNYDDQGRAISSEHAGGADRVTMAYNSDGTVSVTNELGKVAQYSFQTIKGVRRITAIEGEPSANCPNSNSSFTYDSRGLLKTKTDNKGTLTTYSYNARGLESSRTEAAGTPQARTITTEWHPTMFLPLVVTEPKRIIRYQYDNQGRQLSRTVEAR